MVSSGVSLGGILIFRSTRVTSSSSRVLSIGSVVSEVLSSSERSIFRIVGSSYCRSTGESSEESSDERMSFRVFRFIFRGVGGVEVGCCVSGELVVRSVCWSCLLARVDRLVAFVLELVFAACLVMVLLYLRYWFVRRLT